MRFLEFWLVICSLFSLLSVADFRKRHKLIVALIPSTFVPAREIANSALNLPTFDLSVDASSNAHQGPPMSL